MSTVVTQQQVRQHTQHLLESSRQRYDELTRGLSPEQLNWKPGPKKWSILELASHLATNNRRFLANVLSAQKTLPNGGTEGNNTPYASGMVGGWLVRSMRKDNRLPAPGGFQPQKSGLSPQVLEELRKGFDDLLAALNASQGHNLQRTRVRHPLYPGLLRFRLGDVYLLLAEHANRHLAQLERIKAAEGFPQR